MTPPYAASAYLPPARRKRRPFLTPGRLAAGAGALGLGALGYAAWRQHGRNQVVAPATGFGRGVERLAGWLGPGGPARQAPINMTDPTAAGLRQQLQQQPDESLLEAAYGQAARDAAPRPPATPVGMDIPGTLDGLSLAADTGATAAHFAAGTRFPRVGAASLAASRKLTYVAPALTGWQFGSHELQPWVDPEDATSVTRGALLGAGADIGLMGGAMAASNAAVPIAGPLVVGGAMLARNAVLDHAAEKLTELQHATDRVGRFTNTLEGLMGSSKGRLSPDEATLLEAYVRGAEGKVPDLLADIQNGHRSSRLFNLWGPDTHQFYPVSKKLLERAYHIIHANRYGGL
jgi:hypothetical protein